MILLDTCVVSEPVRPVPDPRVLAWLAAQRGAVLYASVLTLGELRGGAGRLAPGARREALWAWIERFSADFADRLLPVTDRVAARWGDLVASAAARGRVIPAVDGLIAATALEHGLTVATRNTADFAGTGVRRVDPGAREVPAGLPTVDRRVHERDTCTRRLRCRPARRPATG